ncbi:MAG TPA: FAD binding domain-containing protein [Xanthobacteraceae bacterium]|jgi:2-furoyl-CoA dehydrogenase FAD binding subunit
MKPRPFDYIRPDTVEEALAVLAEHGEDARILAGGQTLIAMLNLRVVEAAILIDITRIPELDAITETGGIIQVGAAVTQNRLMHWPSLAQKLPLLHAVLPFVGHFQTRNKGTVCGSIAHGDPASEIPLALALLEGEVVLRSQRATRILPAAEFQQGMLLTARAPCELITGVRFPARNAKVAFREVARRHGDFAIVAIAAAAESRESIRIGVAGMADRPAIRSVEADGTGAIGDWIEQLAWELEGYDDIHASAHMRRDLLRRIGPIVVKEAREQCAA